jgi:hypothetical protein
MLENKQLIIDQNSHRQNKNVMDVAVGNVIYTGTNRGEWGGLLSGKEENLGQIPIMEGNMFHLQPWDDI